MLSPKHIFLSCSPISPHFHLRASLSGLCFHCNCPGQFPAKHAGSNLSQTNLSWSHLTKECALNIHQASFHNIIQVVCWRTSKQGTPPDTVQWGWPYAMSFALSELSQKLWFPLITPMPSLKHLPICFSEPVPLHYMAFSRSSYPAISTLVFI